MKKAIFSDGLFCWGLRIRTSISASRARRAAVAPIPNFSSGRYCNMRARSGQVALFTGCAAGIIFHIEQNQEHF